MYSSRKISLVPTVALLLGSTACSDSTGFANPADLRITLQQSVLQPSPILAGQAALTFESINPDIVSSLRVRITAIEFLPAGEPDSEGEGEAGWITVTLGDPVEIDLQTLPSEGESPLTIASGAVEAGEYRMARFIVGDASIVFSETITLGQAFSFDAETAYPATVPSGAETGLKTDVTFTAVEGDENDVALLFDPAATFQNVTATGNGGIQLAPVIRQRP